MLFRSVRAVCESAGISNILTKSFRSNNPVLLVKATIAALQIEYSLWTRDIEENGILATARRLGVAIVAYSPLGRGFLSGVWNAPADIAQGDHRHNMPRFQGENFQKNLELVKRVEQIAAVNAVLAEIGAAGIPQILVYNKIDLTGDSARVERDEYGKICAVRISAQTGAGLDLLRSTLEESAAAARIPVARSAAA